MDLTPIPGFRRYGFSNDGQIYNAATLKPLTVRHGKQGERRVSLTKDDGRTTCVAVDRLAELTTATHRQLPDDAIQIPGHDRYFATPAGDIYAVAKNSIGTVTKLKPGLTIHGYHSVNLYGKTPTGVHLLILRTFHGPRPSTAHEARHLNGIRTDNQKDNLCWGTKKENAADKDRHGTTVRGEAFWSAVLFEVDVCEMRRLHTEEKMTFSALALRFNINKVTARCACLRLTWKHVL